MNRENIKKTKLKIDEEISISEIYYVLTKGNKIFDFFGSFSIYNMNGYIYSVNLYNIIKYRKIPEEVYYKDVDYFSLALLVPSTLIPRGDLLSDKPRNPEDVNFWQYPCTTEKQAFENHKNLNFGDNLDKALKKVNIYAPVPWATYIDKEKNSEKFLTHIKAQLLYYRRIIDFFGWSLDIHSVCQHIYWHKILKTVDELKINNFHLSHKEEQSYKKIEKKHLSLNLRPWPLIAVNYEQVERAEGLCVLPVEKKRILASFIGAYKKHYIDKSRLKIASLAKRANHDNIVISVTDKWFYDDIVYEEQIENKTLDLHTIEKKKKQTIKYNKTLSNSIFSLCPKGAGPNTLRLWESISVGTIPVLFSDNLSLFHESELGRELKDLIVFEDLNEDLFSRLEKVKIKQEHSNKLIKLYESFAKITCF